MRHFGPPERPGYLEQLRPEVLRIITTLIDGLDVGQPFDFVEPFAYQLPVTAICRILGVPREDEPEFRERSRLITAGVGAPGEAERHARAQPMSELRQYMTELLAQRRRQPGDDVLSRMATDNDPDGHLDDVNIVSTAVLLLVAGHETSVNLLASGLLTLLRDPSLFNRLREEPRLMPTAVEEMLRYDPPVQFLPTRTTLDEITLAGTVIPKVRWSRWLWRQATAIPSGFRTPIGLSRTAATTRISGLAVASIAASAHRLRASRPR